MSDLTALLTDELALWTIAVGVVCNAACALLGCYLVLRRMSLLGDAISHAVLPGLFVGFLLAGTGGTSMIFVGALGFGVLTAFLTQTVHQYGRVSEDASLGVVFTSLFALGVVLIARYASRVHIDADCVLYGLIDTAALDTIPVLGVEVPRVLRALVPALLLTAAFVALFWKELKLASFDPKLATSMGFDAGRVHYLLMGMVALVTVAAFEAVGSVLVIAMLIVPAAAAHLLTDRLPWMLGIAVAIGALSALLGYAGARQLDANVAGMMAVAAGGLFTTVVVLAPRYGLLSKAVGNARLAIRIVAEDVVATLYRREEHRREDRTGPAEPVSATYGECLQVAGANLVGRLSLWWLRFSGRLDVDAGGNLVLTDRGRMLGRSLVRSHRLWESFLDEHFELPADHLHEPAERIEHFIGPELQQRLAEELASPERDPHGKAIPDESESTEDERSR